MGRAVLRLCVGSIGDLRDGPEGAPEDKDELGRNLEMACLAHMAGPELGCVRLEEALEPLAPRDDDVGTVMVSSG